MRAYPHHFARTPGLVVSVLPSPVNGVQVSWNPSERTSRKSKLSSKATLNSLARMTRLKSHCPSRTRANHEWRHAGAAGRVDFQRTQTAHPRNHCGIRTGANYQCISGRRELGCSVEAVPRKIEPGESSDRRFIRCWMPARATAELGAGSRSIGVRCSPSAEHRLARNSVSVVRRHGPTIGRSKSSRPQRGRKSP